MKSPRQLLSVFLPIAVLLVQAPAGLAGPAFSGASKMHDPQLPDPSGWDVFAQSPQVLADDFQCTENGPITNIFLWVSWYRDQVGTISNITLSIHADIPAGQSPLGYSMPGSLLWEVIVTNGFGVLLWGTGEQGWLEPPSYFEPMNHTNTYMVAITNIPNPFTQVSGTIYWLDVSFHASGGFPGWKTSTNHWNDDAVYSWQGGWGELTNLMPPFESLDMAFVIDGGGGDEPEEPQAVCPKWIQEPDCDIGLDIESWWSASGVGINPLAADDWLCDGRPVAAIRWWGSYVGYESNSPAELPPPAGSRPAGFVITWYTDVPATNGQFSHPGGVIATGYCPLATAGQPAPGFVAETNYCVSRLWFLGPDVYEHEYEYYLQLTNAWQEKEGRVYWLGIQAVYAAPVQFPWGWKTTPVVWNWNDDAVVDIGGIWNEMRYPPPGWTSITNHPYAGESVNLSFILYSDICPQRCKKWEQPPDMFTGVDMEAYVAPGVMGAVRADDFVSDGRPITDIHWWGSYPGWLHEDPYTETHPPPPPATRPAAFRLSWHAHDAASCLPGPQIDAITVPISYCHEVFYGSVTQTWLPNTTNYEHEYQYYVDLLDTNVADGPWFETNEVHYWLDIQALYTSPVSSWAWGWKITSPDQDRLCGSAISTNGGIVWTNALLTGWPLHPREGLPFDLSFELTTTNVPWTSNTVVPAVFQAMSVPAYSNAAHLWSAGRCGCGRQVLQASSNLPAGEAGWFDVWTNALPRPTNLWWEGPLSTVKFYRVKSVP